MEYKCGSGVTAEVYHGIWRGTAVAVKQIKLGGKRTSKLLRVILIIMMMLVVIIIIVIAVLILLGIQKGIGYYG